MVNMMFHDLIKMHLFKQVKKSSLIKPFCGQGDENEGCKELRRSSTLYLVGVGEGE